MARQYAFKKEAQKSVLGVKTELKSAPGYFIVPKKYTVSGDAAIKESSISSLDLPDSVLEEIAELIDEDDSDLKASDVMQHLSTVSKAKLVQSKTSVATSGVETIRLTLLYGIGAHNFYDGEEELSKEVTDDLVKNIMDYADITNECLLIIGQHNNPLLQVSESTSEMLQNGHTETLTSEVETDS